jgi:hypothetical protein
MSVKDRMATDPVCGMKVDIVVGLPGTRTRDLFLIREKSGCHTFTAVRNAHT